MSGRPRWRWNPDRPLWRRVLTFPIGPCWHITHGLDECRATWQHLWPEDFVQCPCCHSKGSTWPETRGYQCVMCGTANFIAYDRLPEWDHILGSA